MEVHHHSHTEAPHTVPVAIGRKKFKHYFFEFFMLFLAVFCGFLAENFREHNVERHREKEYVMSLLAELKYDSAQYHSSIKKIVYLGPMLDSAFENIKHADRYSYILLGKWNTPINATGVDYKPMMPTIEQLKSSGNLRLIQSRALLNKIVEYETYIHSNFQNSYDGVRRAKTKIYDMEDELCDYTEFNAQYTKNMDLQKASTTTETSGFYGMPILIKDQLRLNLFANSFVNMKAWSWSLMVSFNEADKIANELISLIHSEYHLK